MSARFGDSFVSLESGDAMHLRLTFGALAEICAGFGVNNPRVLAQTLLALTQPDALKIAQAMHFAATGNRPAFLLSEADYPPLCSAIARQFEAGFSGDFS